MVTALCHSSLTEAQFLSGKAVEDGVKPWEPGPLWEIQKQLLAPGFGTAQLWSWQLLGESISG